MRACTRTRRNISTPSTHVRGVQVRLNNLRNLWAGKKEGFDIALLLSDGISTVLQAKDVDGPELTLGRLSSAAAAFSETPTLGTTFGAPLAGRCGTYRLRLQANGTLPAQATVRVTFPERVQLNDPWCGLDPNFKEPVSRLIFQRTPADILDMRVDAARREASVKLSAPSSDLWPLPGGPGFIEFYLTNIRHTSAGPLAAASIEILYPEEANAPDRFVEHEPAVPLLPVQALPLSVATVTPQVLSAGARTTVTVDAQISGRVLRSGLVRVELPAAFRINDGDATSVLDSSIDGEAAQMTVVARDAVRRRLDVRIDAAAIGGADGISESVWQCASGGVECERSPAEVVAGALLMEGTQLSLTLSQIRNLAGGESGNFTVATLLPDGVSVVEQSSTVPSVRLFIGNLTAGSVSPRSFMRSFTRSSLQPPVGHFLYPCVSVHTQVGVAQISRIGHPHRSTCVSDDCKDAASIGHGSGDLSAWFPSQRRRRYQRVLALAYSLYVAVCSSGTRG